MIAEIVTIILLCRIFTQSHWFKSTKISESVHWYLILVAPCQRMSLIIIFYPSTSLSLDPDKVAYIIINTCVSYISSWRSLVFHMFAILTQVHTTSNNQPWSASGRSYRIESNLVVNDERRSWFCHHNPSRCDFSISWFFDGQKIKNAEIVVSLVWWNTCSAASECGISRASQTGIIIWNKK